MANDNQVQTGQGSNTPQGQTQVQSMAPDSLNSTQNPQNPTQQQQQEPQPQNPTQQQQQEPQPQNPTQQQQQEPQPQNPTQQQQEPQPQNPTQQQQQEPQPQNPTQQQQNPQNQTTAPQQQSPQVNSQKQPPTEKLPQLQTKPASAGQESKPASASQESKPAAGQAVTPKEDYKLSDEEQLKKEKEDENLQILKNSIIAANIPQLVMISISYALDLRTSDIHIEPLQNHVRLRYRIDGVLRLIVEYPSNLHPAVVSRIKIMSNLKIDEQRVPQDGRADVTTKDGREMDLRVSTLPTVNGEKIVMRLQDKSRDIPDLPDLGIRGKSLSNLEDALDSPNGILINTGPTGSGKTTTLYSCLARKNTVGINILTIEDPVEIQIDGLNQSQVHHDIEYDFARGMRAALRQDPDVIMVGEIRDKETGNTAIEAALTGHLVFSTLHTNSAVESITRLLNMGIQNYLITSTIELIIAQRLVRKLCDECKEPVEIDDDLKAIAKKALDGIKIEGEFDPKLAEKMQFYGPKEGGCEKCSGVGYKGRTGLYEVFRMNDELRKLILGGADTIDIEDAALKNGMITLEQAGVIKALYGETSINEVYRVARKSMQ